MTSGWLRWLIRRIAPADLAETLIDDLDESFTRESATRSVVGAAWWRARQSAAVVLDVVRLRWRREQPVIDDGARPSLLRTFLRDLRYAARLLWRAPGFTAMAVGTLALGIGANAAIFSLVKAVLIEPLPYQSPDRLAIIWNPSEEKEPTWLALPELESYRHSVPDLVKLGAYTTGDGNLTGGDEPERLRLGIVSGDLFDVLGVPPAIGRTIQEADDQSGRGGVVVLSHGLWQRRFGGDAGIVGRSVQINGQPSQVIGVMPASFQLPLDYRTDQPTDAWVPLAVPAAAQQNWSDHSYFGIGRLRAAATPSAVTEEFFATENQWLRDGHRHEAPNSRWHRAALPLQDFLSGASRRPLIILFAAVAGVLLIACANVVNLLLVRSDARRHEVLVRSSLGAERGVLIRQALTESLLLSLAGAAVGLGVARAGLQLLLLLKPASLPRAGGIALDGGVVLFTLVLALACALGFGLGPALQFARTNLATALREGGRTHTPGRARLAVGRLLVVGQLAASVVLVIAAGLLMRTLVELYRVDLGFSPAHVLTAQLQLPRLKYNTPTATVAFYRSFIDRVEKMPGVESAAAIRVLPLSRVIGDWSITVEDHPAGPQENPNGDFQWTTPDYFRTIGASLVRGRFFEKTDEATTLPVVIINEAMAKRYWPGEDALGRRFKMGTADQAWMTIVGIIRNTHANSVIEAPRSEMYLLHTQLPVTVGGAAVGMDLVVRTSGDPMAMAGPLRAIVHEMDPSLPLAHIRTLDEVVADALSAPRFAATLLVAFAGLALVLASIGTYGTMAMLVATRTPELGIRLALGAKQTSIFRLVAGQGLAIAGAGIATGLVGAAVASRVLTSLLYGVQPLDLTTFLVTPVALALMAFAACVIPARRAATVDPMITMRG